MRHGAKYKVTLQGTTYKVDPDPCPDAEFRQWEAPTAGVAFELQGPDAQSVTMPPTPALLRSDGEPNPELVFEMAEVYELAILRDEPLNSLEDGVTNPAVDDSLARLNALDYAKGQTGRPRKVGRCGDLDQQTLFRGSSPGVDLGPYLSQFLLIGSRDINGSGGVEQGKIAYGVLQIDQRVPIAEPRTNHMVTMDDYVQVQRGIKPANGVTYGAVKGSPAFPPNPAPRRFISTPRDLATYVHFDALYEAYLNACNILIGMGTPTDPAFDHLSGGGAAAGNVHTRRNAGGFALYSGPHILTLVTEVATRALKAVRFQKFNNHIRLRPEALAARIELDRRCAEGELSPEAAATVPGAVTAHIRAFRDKLEANAGGSPSGTLSAISGPSHLGNGTYHLPMAFTEGSPMHPAYGAEHATVAGACVTILKAFFDTNAVLAETPDGEVKFKRQEKDDTAIGFRAPDLPGPGAGEGVPVDGMGNPLDPQPFYPDRFLTLEGELNKLAANISIGRNMAGVQYFSDYYDRLRMGEKIAIGILEEQSLTYPTDPCVLSLPTFDGEILRIGRR